MAMTVAAMAEAAPDQFVMGLGTSSDIIVERWNDIPSQRPYYKTRDMLRFLRKALSRERVRSSTRPSRCAGSGEPRRAAAAAQDPGGGAASGMLRLARKEGDGAILDWLSAEDVKTVAPYVHEGGPTRRSWRGSS